MSSEQVNPTSSMGPGVAENTLSSIGKKLDWLWKNSVAKDKLSVFLGFGIFLFSTQTMSLAASLGLAVVIGLAARFLPGFLSRY